MVAITKGIVLNLIASLVSLLAVVYWVKLYRNLYKRDEREIRGWRWIFAAVLGILLFNVASIYLLANVYDLHVTVNLSKLFPEARNPVIVLDMETMEIFNILGRTAIGLAMTVGAYLIYAPMRKVKGAKYAFVPVTPATEQPSEEELKYNLEPAVSYIVKEERSAEGTRDVLIMGSQPSRSIKIFIDLVTHGIEGLYISRTHPQKVRERYGLKKIPIIWLTRSTEYRGGINPTDLVELSHTIKEFTAKTTNGVVLLDGIEYLITQNSYNDILRFIQSVDETIALSSSRLIVPIDPATLSDKEVHLLEREMSEITSVWKT